MQLFPASVEARNFKLMQRIALKRVARQAKINKTLIISLFKFVIKLALRCLHLMTWGNQAVPSEYMLGQELSRPSSLGH